MVMMRKTAKITVVPVKNESVVYGSTDDGQDKESVEIDKDNPAKQLGIQFLFEEDAYTGNMKSLRLMIVTYGCRGVLVS